MSARLLVATAIVDGDGVCHSMRLVRSDGKRITREDYRQLRDALGQPELEPTEEPSVPDWNER